MTARLVLATHNQHKVQELRDVLAAALPNVTPTEIVGAEALAIDPPAETGVTFAENALLKARSFAQHSGLPAIADDSGIAVAVMGGAPGIFSARWAGRHGDDDANLDLLLAQLTDVPPEHREASFVCAAALVTPHGEEVVELGELRGTLLGQRRGVGGFGYDPIFVPQGEDRSLAELSPAEKNAISHRGRAFRALAPHVARVLGH